MKKILNPRIIYLFIVISFFVSNIGYSFNVPEGANLRVPLSAGSSSFKDRSYDATPNRPREGIQQSKNNGLETEEAIGTYVLDSRSIDMLIEKGDEGLGYFDIAAVDGEILFYGRPYKKDKQIIQDNITTKKIAATDDVDMFIDYDLITDGKLTFPVEACFRGEIVGRSGSEEGFIRIDPPKQISLYCKGKNIPAATIKENIELSILEDFILVLEKLSKVITNHNKLLILHPEIKAICEERGIHINQLEEPFTLGQALRLIKQSKEIHSPIFKKDKDEKILAAAVKKNETVDKVKERLRKRGCEIVGVEKVYNENPNAGEHCDPGDYHVVYYIEPTIIKSVGLGRDCL